MVGERRRIMILVHPGSACGSADFNLGDDAAPLRDELAREIMGWKDDLLVIDGELSDELASYALLGIALESAEDVHGRTMERKTACDFTSDDWTGEITRHFETRWPDGPHDILITGAWVEDEGGGCVNAVAQSLRHHNVMVSDRALRLP